jgi:hypothetical protein
LRGNESLYNFARDPKIAVHYLTMASTAAGGSGSGRGKATQSGDGPNVADLIECV